jgi:two-component sensor histidine kinase
MEQALESCGAAPPHIFVTDELATRPPRRDNPRLENLALQELVASLKDAQEDVLPRFVDIAMSLTGGVAAGLSLFEADGGPGLFRWRHLRGALAAFENATTPRNHSPCGVTLDQNRPVLARHAERFYGWIAAANIEVPEVLLVPLRVGDGAPAGTLWIVSDKEGHFDSGDARVASELAGFVSVALHLAGVRRSLEDAVAQQEILIREMSHRVKNLFAVAEGLVRISARGSETKAEMAESLIGRFHALAGAHSLIRPGFSADAHSAKVSDLGSVLSTIVRPHERTGGSPRFAMEGPAVALGEHAVTGIALVFHELATNAAKHGALKAEDGKVAIRWDVKDDALAIAWDESGSSAAVPPTEGGFGSKLLNDTITRQFAGRLEQDWRASGLKVDFRIPLQRLAD